LWMLRPKRRGQRCPHCSKPSEMPLDEKPPVREMQTRQATALSHPNIALIKYWGNRDDALRLPANSSLSMNLAELSTTTTVEFCSDLDADSVTIDDAEATASARERVSTHLDRIRALASISLRARIISRNNFPAGTGLASSASAFAALTVAACVAAGLLLSTDALSRLARRGSGSACRSVPGGFVLWDACGADAGDDDDCSFGRTLAPPNYWDLRDVIAIVELAHKATSSTQGHALADTSPLQTARVASTPARLERCKTAILARDFPALAEVIEQDALAMHAVMMTGTPSLLYWRPATLAVMHSVRAWRANGLAVAFTIDAGPNVHCICPAETSAQVEHLVRAIPGVERVLVSGVGEGSHPVA
jgi:diphosphomevalonate decarboxylase